MAPTDRPMPLNNAQRLQRVVDELKAETERFKQITNQPIQYDAGATILAVMRSMKGIGWLDIEDDTENDTRQQAHVSAHEDQSLFIPEDDGNHNSDAEYEDDEASEDGDSEEEDAGMDGDQLFPSTAKWLNGLAPYIVSKQRHPKLDWGFTDICIVRTTRQANFPSRSSLSASGN
jgi:hypothetical protein